MGRGKKDETYFALACLGFLSPPYSRLWTMTETAGLRSQDTRRSFDSGFWFGKFCLNTELAGHCCM